MKRSLAILLAASALATGCAVTDGTGTTQSLGSWAADMASFPSQVVDLVARNNAGGGGPQSSAGQKGQVVPAAPAQVVPGTSGDPSCQSFTVRTKVSVDTMYARMMRAFKFKTANEIDRLIKARDPYYVYAAKSVRHSVNPGVYYDFADGIALGLDAKPRRDRHSPGISYMAVKLTADNPNTADIYFCLYDGLLLEKNSTAPINPSYFATAQQTIRNVLLR